MGTEGDGRQGEFVTVTNLEAVGWIPDFKAEAQRRGFLATDFTDLRRLEKEGWGRGDFKFVTVTNLEAVGETGWIPISNH